MMTGYRGWLLGGVLVLLAVGVGALVLAPSQTTRASGGAFTSQESAAIESIVRSYILEHPEIIPEAIDVLQNRGVAKAIEANRDALETPYASAWAGAKDADVVMVEFFDYNCPYCRRSHEDVQRLLREDDDLKVVWRNIPVLGPASRSAAEISLAAAEAGRYGAFHDALFEGGRVTEDKAKTVAEDVGLSPDVIGGADQDDRIRREIDGNLAMARALGIGGTPAYIVGDQLIDGAAGYDALKAAIASARGRPE